MSQRIQLTTGTYFEQLSASKFFILLRRPLWNYLFGLIFSIVFMFIPMLIDDEIDNSFFYIWYFGSSFGVLTSLYHLLYFEKISVDIKYNDLEKQKCFAGVVFKRITIKWPKDSYYLNENVFDSYQRITSVWFIAKSEETKQSKRLIEFTSQKQYEEFIKVLKVHHPELIIREWHG